jgi:hypothetical protein
VQAAIEVARQFADHIAKADYAAAHTLLTKTARQMYSPDSFQRSFEEMTEYEPGPIQKVDIDPEFTLEAWPEKQPDDVAFVYVGLFGDEYVEAVSITVAREDGDLRIRDIEWGRP